MQRDPALPPDPNGGWSTAVRRFENAVIVPPSVDETGLKSGILTDDGDFVPRGAMWRREVCLTAAPDPVQPTEQLSGRWLWGGIMLVHFGHFLTESTARLWALGDQHEGVLFAPRNPERAELKPYQRDLLRHLIGDRPVRMITHPTRVEVLDVAGQGSGLGRIAEGTQKYRNFISRHFAQSVAPDGPSDLFISRSEMSTNHGGFIGEAVLDDRMAAAGYTVFHPERHDISTQIARYKAAKRIVGFDGSALHLLAMIAKPEQLIAIILRRNSGKSSALRRQLTAFSGREAHVIHALDSDATLKTIGKKQSIRELDVAAIGIGLRKGKFLRRSDEWGALTPSEEARIDHLIQGVEA